MKLAGPSKQETVKDVVVVAMAALEGLERDRTHLTETSPIHSKQLQGRSAYGSKDGEESDEYLTIPAEMLSDRRCLRPPGAVSDPQPRCQGP